MFYAVTSPQNNSVHFTLNRKQHTYNEWWWERCISDAQIIEAEAILVFEPRSCFITHDVSVLAKTEVWIGTDVHGLADRQTIPARSDVLAGTVFAEWKSRCVSRKPSSCVLNKSVLSLFVCPSPRRPSAGGSVSTRKYCRLCATRVASFRSQVHHSQWAKGACAEAAGTLLWLELPSRRWLWGTVSLPRALISDTAGDALWD